MNERLKELAVQAGLNWRSAYEECLERFAELIRNDERDKCAQDYLQDCINAVEAARLEEREEYAKFFDENDRQIFWSSTIVRLIRQRGEK